MAEPKYTDTTLVLRGHLEEIYEALDSAYGYHKADDLAREYKSLGVEYKPSLLTSKIENALAKAEGYLTQEAIDVPEG